MKITFLGTGTSQGIPQVACDCEVCTSINPKDKRLRASALIQTNNKTIVIDTGPDFRTQMLRENIMHLDYIFITHTHKDHIAGLDDIRAFNYAQKKALDVYCTEASLIQIKKEYAYIFDEIKYPGIPELNFHIINDQPFFIDGLEVIPIETMHYKMPVTGFRIGDFTYITDANFISEQEKEKINGSKILVLNALKKEKHISHFSLDEAIELGEKLDVEKVYFTHLSHQMGKFEDIKNILPQKFYWTYDQLVLELP